MPVSSIGFVSKNISVNNHILVLLEEDQLMLASVIITAIEPIQICMLTYIFVTCLNIK